MHSYIYVKKSDKALILLHGTGGDEYDLLQIAEAFDNNASVLSIRGDVKENGMNRFFKRLAVGVYDLDNYLKETKKLKETIEYCSKEYNFDLNKSTVIGFSNGANIALGMIQDFPKLINDYILFSPDFINPNKEFDNLSNLKIFISTAEDDPYINFGNVINLSNKLNEKKAKTYTYFGYGHNVSPKVLNEAIKWYKN